MAAYLLAYGRIQLCTENLVCSPKSSLDIRDGMVEADEVLRRDELCSLFSLTKDYFVRGTRMGVCIRIEDSYDESNP